MVLEFEILRFILIEITVCVKSIVVWMERFRFEFFFCY